VFVDMQARACGPPTIVESNASRRIWPRMRTRVSLLGSVCAYATMPLENPTAKDPQPVGRLLPPRSPARAGDFAVVAEERAAHGLQPADGTRQFRASEEFALVPRRTSCQPVLLGLRCLRGMACRSWPAHLYEPANEVLRRKALGQTETDSLPLSWKGVQLDETPLMSATRKAVRWKTSSAPDSVLVTTAMIGTVLVPAASNVRT